MHFSTGNKAARELKKKTHTGGRYRIQFKTVRLKIHPDNGALRYVLKAALKQNKRIMKVEKKTQNKHTPTYTHTYIAHKKKRRVRFTLNTFTYSVTPSRAFECVECVAGIKYERR